MNLNRFGVLILLGLSGCATAPAKSECTDLISLAGGLLKFCQSQRQLDISETAVKDPEDTGSVKIIDDPDALKNLQKGLSLSSDFSASRQLISKACVVKDDTYISLRMQDLKRMLDKTRVPPVAVADPPTDAIEPTATILPGGAR